MKIVVRILSGTLFGLVLPLGFCPSESFADGAFVGPLQPGTCLLRCGPNIGDVEGPLYAWSPATSCRNDEFCSIPYTECGRCVGAIEYGLGGEGLHKTGDECVGLCLKLPTDAEAAQMGILPPKPAQ